MITISKSLFIIPYNYVWILLYISWDVATIQELHYSNLWRTNCKFLQIAIFIWIPFNFITFQKNHFYVFFKKIHPQTHSMMFTFFLTYLALIQLLMNNINLLFFEPKKFLDKILASLPLLVDQIQTWNLKRHSYKKWNAYVHNWHKFGFYLH